MAQLSLHHWSWAAFPSQAPVALHDSEGGTTVAWVVGSGTSVGSGPLTPSKVSLTEDIKGYLEIPTAFHDVVCRLCGLISRARVVPRKTVVGDTDRRFDNLSPHLTVYRQFMSSVS